MLERRSAIATIRPVEAATVRIEEAPDFSLIQVIKPSRDAVKLIGALPKHIGEAKAEGGRTLMKVGPDQYWVIGSGNDNLAKDIWGLAIVTPLSSSRTRIALSGAGARGILAKSAAIDFHAPSFKPGQFAMTGIHHTPVLIHCTGNDSFHVYVLRTFALDICEWLADHAA